MVPLLSELVRQKLHDGESNVGRQSLLFTINTFAESVGPLLREQFGFGAADVLSAMNAIGDLGSNELNVFRTPLRVIEFSKDSSHLLIVGTASTVRMPRPVHEAITACGFGRIIERSALNGVDLEIRNEEIASWIGATSPIDNDVWCRAFESDIVSKAQPQLFDTEALEVLTMRDTTTRCQWLPSDEVEKRNARDVESDGGIHLLRRMVGNRVQSYFASLGRYSAIRAVRLTQLQRDDALRFELLLRKASGAPYRASWKRRDVPGCGLVPLGISWSQIPTNERRIRHLGVPIVFANGSRATAFEPSVVQFVSDVLQHLSIEVSSEDTQAVLRND